MDELGTLLEGYNLLETSGLVGSIAAIFVGLSKRFGGERFVLLREGWHVFAIVLAELGQAAKRIDEQLRVAKQLVLFVLPLLLVGCTFTATQTPIGSYAWTIWDASYQCVYDENGFPIGGERCQASGGLSDAEAQALAELRARQAEAEEARKLREAELRHERKLEKLGADPLDAAVEEIREEVEPGVTPMAPEDEVSHFGSRPLPPK